MYDSDLGVCLPLTSGYFESESPFSHMESEDDCGNTYLLTLYRPEETEWKVFNGLLYMETLDRALDKYVLSAAVTIFK